MFKKACRVTESGKGLRTCCCTRRKLQQRCREAAAPSAWTSSLVFYQCLIRCPQSIPLTTAMILEMFINLPITSGVGNSGSAELGCTVLAHSFTNLPREFRSTCSHSGGLPIAAILLIQVVLAGSLGVTIMISVQSSLKSPLLRMYSKMEAS